MMIPATHNTDAPRILLLIGTRPEAVKMAPVILRLRRSARLRPVVCSTGQHKEMLDSALAEFGIRPDIELAVMRPEQTLNGLAGRLFLGLEGTLRDVAPACILVQGDTTTALAGAVSGFYERIPVGHVEAGLRSGDMRAPYPEEFNRRAAALAVTWHFAPTRGAADNLLREGVNPGRVHITGNTVVDALLHMREEVRRDPPPLPENVEAVLRAKIPYVLITGHRRENFGQGMEDICAAIADLARSRPGCFFLYPVHLNPRVRDVVGGRLAGLPNVLLTAPCAYRPFLRLLDNSLFIMSDSGGIQEEAPSLGKQVLVLRDATERPEGVAAGVCRLVGTNPEAILAAAEELFARPGPGAGIENPYGDGRAAERVVGVLEKVLAGAC
jgi:UDP-N-acetylglucosamine 2-epimerase (non-hydrolysing)